MNKGTVNWNEWLFQCISIAEAKLGAVSLYHMIYICISVCIICTFLLIAQLQDDECLEQSCALLEVGSLRLIWDFTITIFAFLQMGVRRGLTSGI